MYVYNLTSIHSSLTFQHTILLYSKYHKVFQKIKHITGAQFLPNFI